MRHSAHHGSDPSSPRVRVRLEVGLATAPVGDVGVELGRRQIGVAEHLLDAAEVGAALEQVGGERVAQQVGVDPLGLEPRLRGQPPQDQEGAARVSAPPWALRKSSGRWRRSRCGRPRAR